MSEEQDKGVEEKDENGIEQNNDQDTKQGDSQPKQTNWIKNTIIILVILFAAIWGTILTAKYAFRSAKQEAKDTVADIKQELRTAMEAVVGKKHAAYSARLGKIFFQKKNKELNFFKKTQAVQFQLIRWRGGSVEKEDFSMNDLTDVNSLPIAFGQYTVSRASGKYDFRYYISLDPKDWRIEWNEKDNILTVTTPHIQTARPAAVEEKAPACTVDCVTLDEDTTNEMLRKQIPFLLIDKAKSQSKTPEMQALCKEQVSKFIGDWLLKNAFKDERLVPFMPKIEVVIK